MGVLTQFLTGIADRLRKNLGTSGTINASDFADKIDEVYARGYSNASTDFWKQFQKVNGTAISRKSYTQAFMNWGAAEIKPLYTVSNATTDTRYMFYACTGITSSDDLDFSEWTWGDSATPSNSNIAMFQNCSNLKALDWGAQFKFAPKNITQMFKGCSKLESLTNFTVHSLTEMKDAFKGCSGLTELTVTGLMPAHSNFNFADSPKLSPESFEAMVKAFEIDAGWSTIITFNTAMKAAFCDYLGKDEGYWETYVGEVLNNMGWNIMLADGIE